jgi:hypothetical protein
VFVIGKQTAVNCEGAEQTVGRLDVVAEFEQVALEKSRDSKWVLDFKAAVLAIEYLDYVGHEGAIHEAGIEKSRRWFVQESTVVEWVGVSSGTCAGSHLVHRVLCKKLFVDHLAQLLGKA